MVKLTLHARIEIGLAAALLLGSCDSAPSYTAEEAYDLADAADANAQNALSQVSDLDGRLAELETRVADINSRVGY